MHPIRRRKKRPNYGVRTIEVSRGKNGFGFTISGQQPCILSCIVNGSPAERAGLRPGDYLVAVNGHSVSKLPHDDVVRLIGCSNGILKLQIAENYYSDSSDEDHVAVVRSKPKYSHKLRNANAVHRVNNLQQNRIAKVVKDLRSGPLFDATATNLSPKQVSSESWQLPALPPPRPPNILQPSNSKEELNFVVGYLGTIEMPKQLQPGCRSQIVRGCIKRLRVEKRSHIWVLMKVHSDGVTLNGTGGKVLAEYPVNRITFCGSSSEEDKKYLGLVTTTTVMDEMPPSSSCHVFAIQANIFEHQKHASKASSFKISCTSGTLSEGCFEFPSTSEPILNAIKLFCLTKDDGNRDGFDNEMLLANSPQPSHAGSTAASSNSDSGIGFRDDCGNQSDRIVMVDIENQRLHIQQLYNSRNAEGLNIQLQANERNLEPPSANLQQAFACVNALCPLPVNLDPMTVRVIRDSNAAASNRSRSPLNSPSNSSDNEDSSSKRNHSKMSRSKNDRVPFPFSPFTHQECSKSLPPSGLWHEQSIYYHLGLTADQGAILGSAKSNHDSVYKLASKSFDNLGQSFYKAQRFDSKSTDNLMQVGDESFSKNKLRPRRTNVDVRQKTSPLSVSYNGESVVHFNRDSQEDLEEEMYQCSDKNSEILVSFSASSNSNYGSDNPSKSKEESFLHHFKSADDIMSICSYKSSDPVLKVFGVEKPLTTQSLENLKSSDVSKNQESCLDSRVQHYGSLQDLRSFATSNFESSKNGTFETKESCEEIGKSGGVVLWSTSLEKLLEDPAGIHAFAEFLKKEFSQENITFWVSCEKFRKLEDESERKKLASEIFESHLGVGATEPVNVDAHARQCTQEKLSQAPADLFLPAQKQIFNLMKFDSYPRFIKSDLYKECLLRELSGEELPFSASATSQKTDAESAPNRGKLKKSRSDAEDSRRKSLLPWHKKNRSKSKDRGESEYKLTTLEQKRENEDSASVRNEMTSSRSSLASWDLALRGSFSRQSITSGEISERENCSLCRVILSDGATTVVQVRHNESVRELVHRLLEKRGLQYSSFEVFVAGSPKPLPLDEEATTLGNKEVRVEQRVVFRLDLPNRKTVSVKAKATKTLGQVVRSVLNKYSYRPDTVTICSMSENEVLEMNLPITAADGRRLTVLTRSGEVYRGETSDSGASKTFVKAAPTLDEITNRVFEELLREKSGGETGKTDRGSTKSEEWGSEHSSGIFGKFLRRDSAVHEKSKAKSRSSGKRLPEGASKRLEGVVSAVTGKPPLVAKWKPAAKAPAKSESDELYEGLKRAQRSRLEDQRGTEINFELPDFLKDKENAPQSGKKLRKARRDENCSGSKFFDVDQTIQSQGENLPNLGKNSQSVEKQFTPSLASGSSSRSFESSRKCEEASSSSFSRTSKPLTCKTYETPKTSAVKNEAEGEAVEGTGEGIGEEGNRTSERKEEEEEEEEKVSPRPSRKSDPPPLPPKPKYLPSKSILYNNKNFNLASRVPQEITNKPIHFMKPSDVKRDSRPIGNRRAVFLDQPSSSFV